VETQVGLGLGRRAGPVDLCRPPLLGVVPKHDTPAGRVDVEAVGQIPADPIEEAVGVSLPVEVPGLLGRSGVLPPPGPVAPVRPPVDARHGSRSPLSRGNPDPRVSPQLVLRSSESPQL
jgi:hypothetical protein